MTSDQNKTWLPILLIAGALVAWGTILGVGAYLAPSGKMPGADYRKFLVLAATTAGFLLFWGLALASRAAKLRRQRRLKDEISPN
ncbi:MAG: hypothetical protein GXP28_06305 [Planctomycetes bacterium]|nr:hypothetical protein [Planctomycetota bacterium]